MPSASLVAKTAGRDRELLVLRQFVVPLGNASASVVGRLIIMTSCTGDYVVSAVAFAAACT